ncbi:hypothetical protein BDV97DRAFT_417067 [Delphinella strobiligena]|nr:hypothetical protein BDV97DRAFT_417067 [Delphinella strobiligena]
MAQKLDVLSKAGFLLQQILLVRCVRFFQLRLVLRVRKELEQTRKDQEKAYKERKQEAQRWKKSLTDAETLFNERKAQQEREWEEWKKRAEKAAESKRTKEKEALDARLQEVEAQNRREKERMEFNMKCAQDEQQRKIEAAEKAAQDLAATTSTILQEGRPKRRRHNLLRCWWGTCDGSSCNRLQRDVAEMRKQDVLSPGYYCTDYLIV